MYKKEIELQEYFRQQLLNNDINRLMNVTDKKNYIRKIIVELLKRKDEIDSYKQDFSRLTVVQEVSIVYEIIYNIKYVLDNFYLSNTSILKNSNFKTIIKSKLPVGNVLIVISKDFPLEYAVIICIVAYLTGNTLMIAFEDYNSVLVKSLMQIFHDVIPLNIITMFFYSPNNRKIASQFAFDKVYGLGNLDFLSELKQIFKYNTVDIWHDTVPQNVFIMDENIDVDKFVHDILITKFTTARTYLFSPSLVFIPKSKVEMVLSVLKKSLLQLLRDLDDNAFVFQSVEYFDNAYTKYNQAINQGLQDVINLPVDRSKKLFAPTVLLNDDSNVPFLNFSYNDPFLVLSTYENIEETIQNLSIDHYQNNTLCVYTQRDDFFNKLLRFSKDKHIVRNPFYQSFDKKKIYSTDKILDIWLEYRIDYWKDVFTNTRYVW
jgi:acyl-CoA reductase-like NAD-dependent aldehyde dehydrogenase